MSKGTGYAICLAFRCYTAVSEARQDGALIGFCALVGATTRALRR